MDAIRLAQAVEQFLTDYFADRKRARKTASAYAADLSQFVAFAGEGVALATLDAALIGRWDEHLRREGATPATRRRKMATLKVFCTYFVRRGRLHESPFWRVELRFEQAAEPREALTARELRQLLAEARRALLAARVEPTDGGVRPRRAVERERRALRDLALVELLGATGMRLCEVADSNVGDFLAGEAAFKVAGRGARRRRAPVLGDEAAACLHEYLLARRRLRTKCRALFINSSGGRLTSQGIALALDRLGRAAGLRRKVTPGSIRRAVEARLLSKRVDVRVVEAFLGRETTARGRAARPVPRAQFVGELRKVQPTLAL